MSENAGILDITKKHTGLFREAFLHTERVFKRYWWFVSFFVQLFVSPRQAMSELVLNAALEFFSTIHANWVVCMSFFHVFAADIVANTLSIPSAMSFVTLLLMLVFSSSFMVYKAIYAYFNAQASNVQVTQHARHMLLTAPKVLLSLKMLSQVLYVYSYSVTTICNSNNDVHDSFKYNSSWLHVIVLRDKPHAFTECVCVLLFGLIEEMRPFLFMHTGVCIVMDLVRFAQGEAHSVVLSILLLICLIQQQKKYGEQKSLKELALAILFVENSVQLPYARASDQSLLPSIRDFCKAPKTPAAYMPIRIFVTLYFLALCISVIPVQIKQIWQYVLLVDSSLFHLQDSEKHDDAEPVRNAAASTTKQSKIQQLQQLLHTQQQQKQSLELLGNSVHAFCALVLSASLLLHTLCVFLAYMLLLLQDVKGLLY